MSGYCWVQRSWSSYLSVLAATLPLASIACSPAASAPVTEDTDGGRSFSDAGEATPGPADTHCVGQPPQPVDEASCSPDASSGDSGMDMGDDGGSAANCPYGATMYGQHGNDDDCKYWVSWTSGPIVVAPGGVEFTVALWSNVDDSPVTGVPNGINVEAFIPTSLGASCDDVAAHESPGSATSPYLVEIYPGSGVYRGPVVFDASGDWTVRFHIHEECADLLPTSPHGHAAFHVTVP